MYYFDGCVVVAHNMPAYFLPSQQTQNICITFIQRRPKVSDAGPTLYKCYTNILYLWGLFVFAEQYGHRLRRCTSIEPSHVQWHGLLFQATSINYVSANVVTLDERAARGPTRDYALVLV